MIGSCTSRTKQGAARRCKPCTSPFRNLGRRDSSNPLLAFLGEFAGSFERPPAPPTNRLQAQVERAVERLMAQGPVRIEQVARELGFSRQTLYRRLKAEGTTFERLLDRVRRRLAKRLLRTDGASVKEIAYRLGFSDPAAFSRRFKQWTGLSPRDFRGAKGRLH